MFNLVECRPRESQRHRVECNESLSSFHVKNNKKRAAFIRLAVRFTDVG